MNAAIEKTEPTVPSIKINFTPAEMSFNFDEINDKLDEYLATKLTLVTEETLKSEKKVIADLRKEGALIKSTFKDYRDKAIEPLTAVEKKIKQIIDKFASVADEKALEVNKIEDETRALCADLLRAYLYDAWDQIGVDQEFRKADVDDLIKLGSLTAKKELTKAAKQAVTERVNADIALQNKINARLTSVEVKSLRAEINPPLSRVHVEAFLFADNFDERLDEIINAEAQRKAEAEEKLRKKLEAEKQREIESALKAQQDEANRIAEEKAKAELADRATPQSSKEQKPENHTEPLQEKINQEREIKRAEAELNTIKSTSAKFTIKAIIEFSIDANYDADLAEMRDYFVKDLSNSLPGYGKSVTILSTVKA